MFGLTDYFHSVVATSIIRTTTLNASSSSKDTSWGYIPATVWSVVEANTGTICACLPMLKQPLQQFFPRIFGGSKYSSYNSGERLDYQLSKNRRGGTFDSDRRNSTGGTMITPKRPGYGTRESEERIVDQGRGVRVTRTMEVNVEDGSGDSDSISLKDPRAYPAYAQ